MHIFSSLIATVACNPAGRDREAFNNISCEKKNMSFDSWRECDCIPWLGKNDNMNSKLQRWMWNTLTWTVNETTLTKIMYARHNDYKFTSIALIRDRLGYLGVHRHNTEADFTETGWEQSWNSYTIVFGVAKTVKVRCLLCPCTTPWIHTGIM